MQSTIDKVSPFLANMAYPEVVRTTALKVIKGEESAITLTAAVAAVDAVKEQNASAAAANATDAAGETNGQQTDAVDESEPVKDAAGLAAAIARAKEGV